MIPLVLQLLVLVLADLVGLFAAQGAADRLRKHPDEPGAAERRAREVVGAFGGESIVRGVEVELTVRDGRAVAVVHGRARHVVPGASVPVRGRASGSVERFRPDTGAQD